MDGLMQTSLETCDMSDGINNARRSSFLSYNISSPRIKIAYENLVQSSRGLSEQKGIRAKYFMISCGERLPSAKSNALQVDTKRP